jgi:hypothetical protein
MITMRSIVPRRTRVKTPTTTPRPKRHPVHEWAKPYSFITPNVVYKRVSFRSRQQSHATDKSAVTSYQHVMTTVWSHVTTADSAVSNRFPFRYRYYLYILGSTRQVSRFHPMELWPASDTLWFWTKNKAREKSSICQFDRSHPVVLYQYNSTLISL